MLNIISTHVRSVLWHHWRIATFRPAVSQLSDSLAMLVTFLAIFGLTQTMNIVIATRDTGLSTQQVAALASGLFLLVTAVCGIAQLYELRNSCMSCMLGACTTGQLLLCGYQLLGVTELFATMAMLLMGLGLCLRPMLQVLLMDAARAQADRSALEA